MAKRLLLYLIFLCAGVCLRAQEGSSAPFSVEMVQDSLASYPADIRNELRLLRVLYMDFDGKTQQGVLICHRDIAEDLLDIFRQLYEARYPIERIRPISEYGNDDERSMQANNTSCFCYRAVAGTKKLSKHAQGLAIDINPLYNPCVKRRNGRRIVQPATATRYADRTKSFPHKITRNDLACRLFRAKGFRWGGDWRTVKDYQHFER